MIPYVELTRLRLFGTSLDVFQVSLALAIGAAFLTLFISLRRKTFTGRRLVPVFLLATSIGFLGAALASALYYPQHWSFWAERIGEGRLFYPGISSLGGILASSLFLLGAVSRWSLSEKVTILDAGTRALSMGLLVGRFGCALVHDHLGVESTSFLAVRFPSGSRLDLGVCEFIFLLVTTCFLGLIANRLAKPGLYCLSFLFSYIAFRITIDFYRPEKTVYASVSLDVFLCLACASVVVIFIKWIRAFHLPARPPAAKLNQPSFPD